MVLLLNGLGELGSANRSRKDLYWQDLVSDLAGSCAQWESRLNICLILWAHMTSEASETAGHHPWDAILNCL